MTADVDMDQFLSIYEGLMTRTDETTILEYADADTAAPDASNQVTQGLCFSTENNVSCNY